MIYVLNSASVRLERLWRLWPLALLFSGALVVFAWMSDAVGDHDGVTAVDGPVSLWFAAHRSVMIDQTGLLLAKATSPAVLIGLTVIVAGSLFLRKRRVDSYVLLGSVVVAYAAGAVAKFAEHRARPLAPVNLSPETEASFPSGHVLVVTVLAFVLLAVAWNQFDRRGRIVAGLVATAAAAIVALDRLVVGAHWLTDVVGAMALAGLIVAAAVSIHRVLGDRSAAA